MNFVYHPSFVNLVNLFLLKEHCFWKKSIIYQSIVYLILKRLICCFLISTLYMILICHIFLLTVAYIHCLWDLFSTNGLYSSSSINCKIIAQIITVTQNVTHTYSISFPIYRWIFLNMGEYFLNKFKERGVKKEIWQQEVLERSLCSK